MNTSELAYQATIEQWRAQAEARLRADDGWLTVSGLFWLHEGANSAGSAPSSDIVLPAGSPATIGSFFYHDGQVVFEAAAQAGAEVNGKPAGSQVLRSTADGAPDLVTSGELTLFVHRSGARHAIRVRDRNNPARQQFAGRRWFPVREEYRVDAAFVPYDPPKLLPIANIVGDIEQVPSPGYVAFTIDGRELRLDASAWRDRGLWLHFHDLTAGSETYPGGRFLYTAPLAHGRAVLDFNQAVSPPCAFTPFATCPVILPQNRLGLRIPAGELWHERH